MDDQMKEKLLLSGAFIIVVALGFLAGRLSVKIENVAHVDPIKEVGEISTFVPTINFTAFEKGILYGKSNGKDLRVFVQDQMVEGKETGEFFVDTTAIKQTVTEEQGKYQYVASKNSTKYHPIGTSAANSIKPENRRYFVTKEEAEKAGFVPGGDVK